MNISTIGIIGGGQLCKMIAIAAINLGYKVFIYTNNKNDPGLIVGEYIVANYDDHDAIEYFCTKVDCITCEFENIPYEFLQHVKRHHPLYPNAEIFKICQDRIQEKKFLTELEIAVGKYSIIHNQEDFELYSNKNDNFFIKRPTLGYDGKGNAFWDGNQESLPKILDYNNFTYPLMLEKAIDFYKEISIIVCRDTKGNIEHFPIAENVHKNGILHSSFVPAGIDDIVINSAKVISAKIAEKFNLIGILAIEFFLLKDNSLLVNEMAPRPHNSGHWSLDACNISQFEQLVRIITKTPMLPVHLKSQCKMINLIGDDIINITSQYIANSNAKIYRYGKDSMANGRKTGHINIMLDEQ
ncbi:MAG: 5-(carboxyamino)imidazole ribonucleotide synthase [Anaplasmataceae bacterium]|nr:5-(carboxyamino)imidazole ribonucleotide synthase [Anaplasmataceae bacterium]